MTSQRLTPLQWLICAIAALGFAFDIYAVLMAPLVVGPAIGELTRAKPGTPEFRAALRDAMEGLGHTVFAHGVMNWTKDNHWGYTNETGVMLQVKDGKFVVAQ